MKNLKRAHMAAVMSIVVMAAATVGCSVEAQPPVTDGAGGRGVPVEVKIDPTKTGEKIGDDFSGVSFETHTELPDRQGNHLFSPDNKDLIALFRGLGIRSLRVGGNSLDNPMTPVPTETDIDSLYGFAKAAGVKVIYSVRLKGVTDPTEDVKIAKYVTTHYADLTECITIGNEPNIYFPDAAPTTGPTTAPKTAILGGIGDAGAVGAGYAAYRKQWELIAAAMVKEIPTVKLCGPSSTPGKVAWARAFAKDEGAGELRSNLDLITQHSYPGGNAQKVTDASAGRALLLSPAMETGYEKFYNTFVPTVKVNRLNYRLEESNSLFHGGARSISNTVASSLWALDFMHWWASHSAAGINFHTNNNHTDDETTIPGGYDLFWTSPTGLKLHPIAYGVKAFDIGGHGAVVPVELKLKEGMNLTAYAVKGAQGELYVTLINRENVKGDTAPEARDADVTINVEGTSWWNQNRYTTARVMFLKGDKNDLAAIQGMTLGSAKIQPDGAWSGTWTNIEQARNRCLLHVAAGSAAVVELRNAN